MDRKTITIRRDTWAVLLRLKGRYGFRSLDDVIRFVLKEWVRLGGGGG